MRAKINTGQKENKLIKHNGKYEFGRLPGRYQILRQHVIEMETWSFLGARNTEDYVTTTFVPEKNSEFCN
jgi:hypothetical protein